MTPRTAENAMHAYAEKSAAHVWQLVDQQDGTTDVASAPTKRRRRRSGRRRALRRRRSIALALLFAASIGVVCVAIAATLRWQAPSGAASGAQLVATASQLRPVGTSPASAVQPAAVTQVPARPVYRHSVVPGGVHTPAEVVNAIAADPVVADHYAGLDTSRLRVERLTRPLTAHVSYRIGDKIFWTKRKLQVAAGEMVLTDGDTTLRARCGNVISTTRRAPQFAGEPEEAEFEVTLDPIELASMPQVVVFRPSLVEASPPAVPPVVPLRVVEIPGPSTFVLLGLGIAVAGATCFFRRANVR